MLNPNSPNSNPSEQTQRTYDDILHSAPSNSYHYDAPDDNFLTQVPQPKRLINKTAIDSFLGHDNNSNNANNYLNPFISPDNFSTSSLQSLHDHNNISNKPYINNNISNNTPGHLASNINFGTRSAPLLENINNNNSDDMNRYQHTYTHQNLSSLNPDALSPLSTYQPFPNTLLTGSNDINNNGSYFDNNSNSMNISSKSLNGMSPQLNAASNSIFGIHNNSNNNDSNSLFYTVIITLVTYRIIWPVPLFPDHSRPRFSTVGDIIMNRTISIIIVIII